MTDQATQEDKRAAMLAAFKRRRGVSDAQAEWKVYCALDHKFPDTATLADAVAEYARWPERLNCFCHAAEPEEDGDILTRVSVLRTRPGEESFRFSAELPMRADASTEHVGRAHGLFFAHTLKSLHKLGNPRWDALVEEENAR